MKTIFANHLFSTRTLMLIGMGLVLIGSVNGQTVAPSITSLSPNSLPASSAGFIMVVTGTNFGTDSIVQWNGSSRTTSYVSSSRLAATIPASDVATTGTANVTVASGGNTSSPVTFTISTTPVPRISSIFPTSVTAGSNGFRLTVLGEGFTSGSVIQWNGLNLATDPFSLPGDIEANISAYLLSAPGLVDIRVVTGSNISNTVQFTIAVSGAAPYIDSLDPNSIAAKGPDFTLKVEGHNFTLTSAVLWDGTSRPTTYINSSTLYATISAADILQSGTAVITVLETAPGGATSNAVNFTISPYSSMYFPQVAAGGGYTTVLTLMNIGTAAAQGTLRFTDQSGAQFIVAVTEAVTGTSLGVGSAFTVSVASGATAVYLVNAPNSGAAVTSGWARIDSVVGSLNGVATYQYRQAGQLKTAAGVLSAAPVWMATIPVFNDDTVGRFTGFAIANPTDHSINVKIYTLDKDGNLLDTLTAPELTLMGARKQVAKFLHEYLPSRSKFVGSMAVVVSGSDKAVIVALLQDQGIVTAIPVVSGAAPVVPRQ